MTRAAALTSVGLLVLVAAAPPAAAQPTLQRVEGLISDGRLSEARTLLEGWWSDGRTGADPRERQHGLWLRGRLSLEGDEAELDFRRLAVEYPGGPYSDDALLRLAQGAHAEGRLREAERQFRALLRDYPESPLRSEARSWLERFGAPMARAGEEPDEDEPPAEGARSKANPPDTAGAGRGPETPGTPGASLPYAVQLGAFSSERRARRLWERARSAGLDARLARIPGSGLIRVRVGRFPDSPPTEDLLHRVRALGFEATIVTDALKEESLR